MRLCKILPGLLLILLLLAACGERSGIRTLDGRSLNYEDVDATVTKLMDAAHVTGLCLAILNENTAAYVHAYGYRNQESSAPLDVDTVMQAASFSKAVFAYLVLQLVQDKILDLDKPLFEYLERPLPEYEGYADLASDERWKLLTARMCLNHTTGFPNLRAINPRGNGKLEFFFEPGSRYAYSGEGIDLLQFVVEKITRKNVEALASEMVFIPLGMERTSYVWKDEFEDNFAAGHDMVGDVIEYKKRTVPNAGGSLLTTIADYAAFIEAVMQRKGLDPDIWEMMVSPKIRIDSKRQFPTLSSETSHDNDPIALSYGLGWGTFRCPRGRAFFKEGHGPGFQHYNVNFIDEKISVIVMTNSDNGESIFKPLLGGIAGDTYSPWDWEAYVPYDEIEPRPIGVYLYDFLLLGNAENAVETYRAMKHSPVRDRFIFDESQLLDLGKQMMKEGKTDYAIELFTLNIAEYPESASSYESLGDACREKGRISLARDSYQKALDLDPGREEVQQKLNMLK